MRLVIAQCTVDYVGRLTAHLPSARRLLLIKADGSVSVHADDRAYKPLNWMSPPCWMTEDRDGPLPVWVVENKAGEQLRITVEEIEHDSSHELGVDPGLVKDGVEAHLQALLAEHVELLGAGYTLVRREYMTPIGPVDLLCRDEQGRSVAVEIKRRGEIDGVEQLTRYLDLLNRDTVLAPVSGVFAAQQIKPQARTLATDRGIRCVTLDYDEMRGHGQLRVPAVLSAALATFGQRRRLAQVAGSRREHRCRRRVASRRGPTDTTTRFGRSPASRATKTYRCPGCDHEIRPGTAHLVVWQTDLGEQAVEDRRHWHTPCWQHRATRSPTRKWS